MPNDDELVPIPNPETQPVLLAGDVEEEVENPSCSTGRHRLPPPVPIQGEKEWRPPFGL
jgi:hypothetical protein